MSLIPRCVVCDAPVPNIYAPSACCEGETCPKERRRERADLEAKELPNGRFQVAA